MFAILGGFGGDGKSTLLASLVATFSRGGTLPDLTTAPQLNTLMLAAEDDPGRVIRPRLDLHRADVSRVHLLKGTVTETGGRGWFNLKRDVAVMREVIDAHDIRLVVMDPLSSYMPSADRNNEGDVRDALMPLMELMEEAGVAIIGVMHVGKADGGRRPMQRLMGSTAFSAIARTVWMVHDLPKEHQDTPTGPDDFPPKKKVLGIAKSNLSYPPQPLMFARPLDGPLKFLGVSPVSLEDAFAGDASTGGGTKLEAATAWLADYLKGGSKRATDIYQAAREQGISEATLKRAKTDLNIETNKSREPNGPHYWALPAGTARVPQVSTFHNVLPIEDAHMSTLSTFPTNGEFSPRDGVKKDGPASGEESKVLNDPYISSLSTFDSGNASSAAGQCCEPGCSHPIAPGGRYYCAQHRPGAA
jgi:hypothetical protein